MLVWEWDPERDEVKTKGDLRRVFGATFQSFVESLRLVHPDDVEEHWKKLERVGREGGVYYSEFRIHRADNGATA